MEVWTDVWGNRLWWTVHCSKRQIKRSHSLLLAKLILVRRFEQRSWGRALRCVRQWKHFYLPNVIFNAAKTQITYDKWTTSPFSVFFSRLPCNRFNFVSLLIAYRCVLTWARRFCDFANLSGDGGNFLCLFACFGDILLTGCSLPANFSDNARLNCFWTVV